MTLDKELYRQAYQHYQDMEAHKQHEHLGQRKRLSPLKAWQQYVDLVEFCWKLCPSSGKHQRQEKLAAINRYYERVQALEAWRKAHGETSREGA